MFRIRYASVVILILAAFLGYFVYHTTGTGGRFDFKLGLDLSGGTHLVYSADVSKIQACRCKRLAPNTPPSHRAPC
jgi:preprotein translocase subunit SecD